LSDNDLACVRAGADNQLTRQWRDAFRSTKRSRYSSHADTPNHGLLFVKSVPKTWLLPNNAMPIPYSLIAMGTKALSYFSWNKDASRDNKPDRDLADLVQNSVTLLFSLNIPFSRVDAFGRRIEMGRVTLR
jgi:hypothetical protein